MKTEHRSSYYGYIYLLQCSEHFKIGFSLTPHKRIQQLRTGSPHPIRLVHELRTPFYKLIEKQLHHKFRSKRGKGEWFTLDPEDVEHIRSLNQWGNTPQEQRERDEREALYHARQEAARQTEENYKLAVLLSGAAAGAGLCLDLEDPEFCCSVN